MHKFLRAIGFSKINRDDIKELVLTSVKKNDTRGYTMSLDDVMLAEFSKDVGEGIGITAAGTFSEDDLFHTDYYFPYLKGTGITSTEDVSVERHAARDSYAGICDDVRLGMSLIFYVQNKIPYISAQVSGKLQIKGTTLTLSGLSIKGTIILPSDKGNPDEAADILLKAAPELDSALVKASQKYLSKEYKADVEKWGYMDPERWNAFYNWINDNDLFEEKIAENTGFTNDYLV